MYITNYCTVFISLFLCIIIIIATICGAMICEKNKKIM